MPLGQRTTSSSSDITLTTVTLPASPHVATGNSGGGEGGYGGGYTYWRSSWVPSACLVGNDLDTTEKCDVVDAAEIGGNLSGPISEKDASKELLRVIAEEAARKAVFFSFSPEVEKDAKVSLVRAIYTAQANQLDAMAAKIEQAMKAKPAFAEWLHQQAAQHPEWVANVRDEAKSQTKESREEAEEKVSSNADSPGFEGKCRLACRQLNAEWKGLEAFEASSR